MLIEEKARAYDRVSKEVKDFFEGRQKMYSDVSQTLEYLFPELKETEDERIRKGIIELVKQSSEVLDKQNQNNMIAWLEKQGEQKPADKVEPKFKVGDTVTVKPMSCHGKVFKGKPFKIVDIIEDNYVSDDGKTYSISLQDGWELVEQKPTDKVEPKFKIGDWVVCEITGSVYQIKNCIENLSNHKYGYDLTNGGYINSDEINHYHLWNIQDAKDGDVLVASDGSIFLFADVVDCACKYYVALATDNYIKINKEEKGGYWETSRAVYPATKEQRDLLFSEIKEEGYEWDAEKKELKKIEQQPAWSEEDERLCSCIIEEQEESLDNVENSKYGHSEIISDLKEMYQERIDWLKSLKQRIGGGL